MQKLIFTPGFSLKVALGNDFDEKHNAVKMSIKLSIDMSVNMSIEMSIKMSIEMSAENPILGTQRYF